VVVWWLTVPCALSYAFAPSWPWLIPGLILAGLYMANNPAFKTYVLLKSERSRASLNMMLVFGGYSVGMIVAPLLGGLLAAYAGMRVVFLVGAALCAVSSTCASFIADVAYSGTETTWTLGAIVYQRQLRRCVVFFLIGFLAIYIAQPFLTPFLAQAHHMGYAALGLYASLASLGAAVMGPLAGHATDRWGPRSGLVMMLAFLLLGVTLLLYAPSPTVWALAFLACGAFDALRFSSSAIVGLYFGVVPMAWGFAVFDATMGIPMVAGSLLGGIFFRWSVRLPLIVVAILAVILLAALVAWPLASRRRDQATAGPIPRALNG
jgi:MFS family permease